MEEKVTPEEYLKSRIRNTEKDPAQLNYVLPVHAFQAIKLARKEGEEEIKSLKNELGAVKMINAVYLDKLKRIQGVILHEYSFEEAEKLESEKGDNNGQ